MNLGMRELFLAGLLIAIAYYILLATSQSQVIATEILWIIGVIVGVASIPLGFDYDRIRFSSVLSFLAIVLFMYVFTIALTDLEGVPMAIALLVLPFVSSASIGAILSWARRESPAGETIVRAGWYRRFRSLLYELDPIMWVFLAVSIIYLTLFLLLPIGYMLGYSFISPSGLLGNFVAALRDPSQGFVRPYLLPGDDKPYMAIPSEGTTLINFYLMNYGYGTILNSLIIASIVTIFATLLGILVAFVIARFNFRGKELLRIIALIPLFVTPFVNAYAIKLLFSDTGPLSQLIYLLTGKAFKLQISGMAGVIITQIITFYPIVYLNAYASFINIDPSMEEQAENLGSKGLKLFLDVTMPLAMPGIAAGAILVYIFSLEDLGAPIIWNFDKVMSYYIFRNFMTEQAIISPMAATIGVIMLFFAIMGFLAIRNYVSMKSYAMISRGGRLVSRARKPGILASLAIYLGVFPLVIFTSLPQISVVLLAMKILQPFGWSFILSTSPGTYLESFKMILSDPQVFNGILNTLKYATSSVIIAVILAIMVGYSVSRINLKWLTNILDSIATMPIAIPGLVIALGYWFFFKDFASYTGLSILNPLDIRAFQLWAILVIAFSVRRLPYVVRSVYAGFQQVHINLEEAAMNLGASRTRVIFGVVFPFILSYVLSGALLGFVYMATEVTTSITLGGLKADQAPVTYWLYMYTLKATATGIQEAAAIGSLLILIQLIAVLIIIFVFKQRYAFIGV
ncbi:ABC transporter permease [Thermogladius sp. 4427co]|uniref:ABC transporter permease n=1 Tax=Thermogladius sp. 4427co TaxID=3450718 RepID=UPI003F78FA4E